MVKKIAASFIAVMLIMSFCITSLAIYTIPSDITAITTNNVILYEANSGAVLYEKNADRIAYPASTTKVLTAIIIIDICENNLLIGDPNVYFKDDETFKIDENYTSKTFSFDDRITATSVETRGSVLGLREGENLTVRDLMHGMMLVSGNDCARALALYFSPNGTVPGFAKLMNAYAKELGAEKSNFVVPHGLHDDSHTTTAYDMAVITAYALKNQTFRNLVATETYDIAPTNKHSEGFAIENTNRLIHTKADDNQSYKYEYAIGVKTGDTTNAGRCIIAAAEKGDKLLIVVLFGDHETSKLGVPRYENSKKLFEYGFNEFIKINASELNLETNISASVEGMDTNAVLKADVSNAQVCLNKNQLQEIKDNAKTLIVRTTFNTNDGMLHAPLKAGDVVGTVQYVYNNDVVLTTSLSVANDINGVNNNATTGVEKTLEGDIDLTGYDWIFWALLFCILLVIILVIVALVRQPVRRRNSQLRRRSRRF